MVKFHFTNLKPKEKRFSAKMLRGKLQMGQLPIHPLPTPLQIETRGGQPLLH